MTNEIIPAYKLPSSEKYFNTHHLTQLIQTIDNPRDLAYILYQTETGLRASDVVNTQTIHIDWQNNTTKTYDHKKDQWRTIVWPDTIKTTLKKWMRERQILNIKSPLLFPFTTRTADRIIKKWAQKINHPHAEKASTHWLRRTYIKLSQRRQRNMKSVQANTGDSIHTILKYYSELTVEERVEETKNKPLIPQQEEKLA